MPGRPARVVRPPFAVVNASGDDAPGSDMRLIGVDARTGEDPGPGAGPYPELDSRGFTAPGIGTASGRLLVPESGGGLVAYASSGT